MQGKPSRIHKIEAINFMKLKCVSVDITDDNRVIEIKGDNGAGKTSFIDLFWFVLKNPGIRKWPDIITKGENFVEAKLTFGDIVVERRMTENGTVTLRVYNDETKSQPFEQTPQQWINDRLGRSIDIREFSALDKQSQVEALLDVVGLKEKSQDILSQIKTAKDDKSALARAKKEKSSLVNSLRCEKVEPVDVSETMKEIDALDVGQKIRKEKVDDLSDTTLSIKKGLEYIEELNRKLEEAGEKVRTLELHKKSIEGDLEQTPDKTDEIEAARQKLRDASEINEKATRYKKFVEASNELDRINNNAKNADDMVKLKTAEYKNLLATAKFPVKELSFDVENGILYDGISLTQEKGSSRELLVLTVIAAATIPENGFRFVRIPGGESIGPKMMPKFIEVAEKYDVQLIMEIQTTDKENGIILEDGAVINNTYGGKDAK